MNHTSFSLIEFVSLNIPWPDVKAHLNSDQRRTKGKQEVTRHYKSLLGIYLNQGQHIKLRTG